MRKKRVFLLAEMLCLIAGASAFFAVSPLAQAAPQAQKPLQATFLDLVTSIAPTGPQGPGVIGMTIQLSKDFSLTKQDQWAWVYVSVPVNGKVAYFMGEAFFGIGNKRSSSLVELAEIQPPSDPNDPALQAILNKHQLYSLVGLPPNA